MYRSPPYPSPLTYCYPPSSCTPAGTPPAPLPPSGGITVTTVTFSVSKPQEGDVGELRLGPMARDQRAVFGRIPSCDVVLEHLSVSRQHAVVTVDATGCAFVTDLQSGV